MRRIFFPRPLMAGPSFVCGLKIINAAGQELSLGLDNSHTHDVAWRGELRVYDENGADLGEPITGPTPEQFLERLATHLGYTITKEK